MPHRRPKRPALLTMGLIALPAVLDAQSYDTGGIQLRFGTTFGVEATDNRSLLADADTSGGLEAVAGLSFGLLTATPASSFALDAGGKARAGIDAEGFDISVPRVSAAYNRSRANSALDLSAAFARSDLTRDEALVADDIGPTGTVRGTAIRRTLSSQARLTWGLTSRVSYSLSAAFDKATYSGGFAAGLDGTVLRDTHRLTLGGTSELDLTKASHLKLGVSYSTFGADDAIGTSETTTLSTGLSIDRPRGAISTTVSVTDSEAGQRYSLSVGRALALPGGAMSGKIGVTGSDRGDTALIGSLRATRELPAGVLTFALSRDVSRQNEQDAERLTTQAAVAYSRSLTPLSGLDLGFDLTQVEDIRTAGRSRDVRLGVTYTRSLTGDWSAAAGYTFHNAKDDPGQTARSHAIFLQLRRTFVTRY